MVADDVYEQVLTAHADALNQGRDHTAWLVAKYPEARELPRLLALARQLKQLLVPVRPRPQFVAQLAQTVRNPQPQQPHSIEETLAEPDSRWVWWGAAAVGSIVAGTVGFLFWRRTRPAAL